MALLQEGKFQVKQCYILRQSVIYGNINIDTTFQYKISILYLLLLSVKKHGKYLVNGHTNIKLPVFKFTYKD